MISRVRLRLRAALLTSYGLVRDLGTGLSYVDRATGRDGEGNEMVRARVGGIELSLRLEELRAVTGRGVLRAGDGELRLGADAERMIREAERIRRAATLRRAPTNDAEPGLPLYLDLEHYTRDGLI